MDLPIDSHKCRTTHSACDCVLKRLYALEEVAKAAAEMVDLVNMPSIPNGLTVMEAWGSKMPALEEALAKLEETK